MLAARAAVTDRPSGRSLNLDPDRWRAPSDGPRWLYAEPGRLRVVWRLAVFALALALFQPVVESVLTPLVGGISGAFGTRTPAYPWVTLAAIGASLVVALRMVDQRPWHAVALGTGAWRPRTLLGGVGIGALAILATFALLWVSGSARIETLATSIDGAPLASSWSATSLRLALLLAPAALWEELLFRGYLWTVAEEAADVRVARWTTAIAFGTVHLLNPGANALSTLLVVTAGFGLGAIREFSGSLPAAGCAHVAWNWVMAAVLHMPVSGILFETPGNRTVIAGPDWWTGGAWGPEGGAAALLVMGGALVVHARQARRTSAPRSSAPLNRLTDSSTSFPSENSARE